MDVCTNWTSLIAFGIAASMIVGAFFAIAWADRGDVSRKE